MNNKFQKSKYRDTDSLVVENEFISTIILPHGGRMVSLLDKSKNKEFLVQQNGSSYNKGEYDGDYVKADPCGFDDMFPNIFRSFYPDFPWEGVVLPDHGEVWAIPWEYNIDGSKLKMEVNGIRLPYTLEKQIQITGEKEIRIDYKATNKSSFDLKFIWTAHPMLVAEEGMEFELPPECNRAVSVLNGSQRTGDYGNIFSWRDLIPDDINIFRDSDRNNVEKYYFLEPVKNGIIKINYPSTGSIISLKFPAGRVPYIGILIDEGSWKKDLMFIIPEPCTTPMDRIDIADLYVRSSLIGKNSSLEWYLKISL